MQPIAEPITQSIEQPVPVFIMGPNTISAPAGVSGEQGAETSEETKSHIDHSYIEAYSGMDVDNETAAGQLEELKTEHHDPESEGEHNEEEEVEGTETKPDMSLLATDVDDSTAKDNEEIGVGRNGENAQDQVNEPSTGTASVQLNMEVWDEQNALAPHSESVDVTCYDGVKRTGMLIIFLFIRN